VLPSACIALYYRFKYYSVFFQVFSTLLEPLAIVPQLAIMYYNEVAEKSMRVYVLLIWVYRLFSVLGPQNHHILQLTCNLVNFGIIPGTYVYKYFIEEPCDDQCDNETKSSTPSSDLTYALLEERDKENPEYPFEPQQRSEYASTDDSTLALRSNREDSCF